MANGSRRAFDKNCEDIERLLEIHGDIGGTDPGRRYGMEVLNKSSVVLLCAFWEAYCEDLAAEALTLLVAHAPDHSSLPAPLRKRVASELENEKHDLAVWQLAGDGWRQCLKDRLARLQDERNRRLNTPKADRIDELFDEALGVSKVSGAWYWPGMSKSNARQKLDHLVSLRGDVAHRGAASRSVKRSDVSNYYNHIKRLVGKTGGRVSKEVKSVTGKSLISDR